MSKKNKNINNSKEVNVTEIKDLVKLPDNFKKQNDECSPEDKRNRKELMRLILSEQGEKPELKLKGEDYVNMGASDEWNQSGATFFSYQKNAAKDFIYRFNKSGILSDQVGMGKTIEAGMIISELAYRKELKSLLILVPNDNMVDKWETELARKFGFRNCYNDINIMEGNNHRVLSYLDLPKMRTIKSLDDLYVIIFNANEEMKKKGHTFDMELREIARTEYDKLMNAYRIESIKNSINNCIAGIENTTNGFKSKTFKKSIVNKVYAPICKDLINAIARVKGISVPSGKDIISDEGRYFFIADMCLEQETGNTAEGVFEKIINKDIITNSIVDQFDFYKIDKGLRVLNDLNYAVNQRNDHELFKEVARTIKKLYKVLIINDLATNGDKLLSSLLNKEFTAESISYCTVLNDTVNRGYSVIDLLIDCDYDTLIVDEAHNYIRVSHKKKALTSKNENEEFDTEFFAKDLDNYYVFPLYDDYYYMKKEDCLYLKVKELATRSTRKIFMTATPIKSDMIDFYLLYLLAGISFTSQINSIRKLISESDKKSIFIKIRNKMNIVQKESMNFSTHEEVVVKYVFQYYNDNKQDLNGKYEDKIRFIVEKLNEGIVDDETIQKICINEVRKQFESKFMHHDKEKGIDVPIKSISKLVSSDKGVMQWKNMYSQIGIRHTRHQTHKLDQEHLDFIRNEDSRDEFKTLPLWSKRNGTVLYIRQADNYFDRIIREKLKQKGVARNEKTNEADTFINDYEEDKLKNPRNSEYAVKEKKYEEKLDDIKANLGDEEKQKEEIEELRQKIDVEKELITRKYEPLEKAIKIYRYINSELTGVANESEYSSINVDYDDFKMHCIAALMTGEAKVVIKGENEGDQPITTNKKIKGKVLLFTENNDTREMINEWFKKELQITSRSQIAESERGKYQIHKPLGEYNKNNPDAWTITEDIRDIKKKDGNCLVLVEPNKYEEGVDLQDADTLINFDIKFCPLQMEQRIGRIDRVKIGNAKQSQLDIISFTQLNDMSGFMVDFLANDLRMFNSWKGDTTGIVSMPIGEKENSSTYEEIVKAINVAYKALYNLELEEFLTALDDLSGKQGDFQLDTSSTADEEEKHFVTEIIAKFQKINEVRNRNNKDNVKADFDLLRQVKNSLNTIIVNSIYKDTYSDQSLVSYNGLTEIAEAHENLKNNLANESITAHVNDLKTLRDGIKQYYEAKKRFYSNGNSNANDSNSGASIENEAVLKANKAKERSNKKILTEIQSKLESIEKNELFNVKKNDSSISVKSLKAVLDPINKEVETIYNKYLDKLLDLFNVFSEKVEKRSMTMAKFIRDLAIEDFKEMAGYTNGK